MRGTAAPRGAPRSRGALRREVRCGYYGMPKRGVRGGDYYGMFPVGGEEDPGGGGGEYYGMLGRAASGKF